MHSYLCHEGEGEKGGVNVASMVMNCTQTCLAPSSFNPRSNNCLTNKITFAADNCTGQNKNNTVIRLANSLVKGGCFAAAEVAFLVKGHTKNSCDRSFNLMKQCFHRKNVRTKEMTLKALNKISDVTMVDCTPSIFKDCDALLDKLCKRCPPSTIMKSHLFAVHQSDPTIVTAKATANYENAIKTQLAKDMRKAPTQITLPIPLSSPLLYALVLQTLQSRMHFNLMKGRKTHHHPLPSQILYHHPSPNLYHHPSANLHHLMIQ